MIASYWKFKANSRYCVSSYIYIYIYARANQSRFWSTYVCLRMWIVCQKLVSRVGKSNHILHILWNVITCPWYLWEITTCPCPWCLLLAHKSSCIYSVRVNYHNSNISVKFTKLQTYTEQASKIVWWSSLPTHKCVIRPICVINELANWTMVTQQCVSYIR